MKTRILITAAALLFSVSIASADSKQRTLTFRDSLGRTLTMPMLLEEANDSAPFDTRAEFMRLRANNASRVFDISPMLTPEKEEELPFDLDEVLNSIH